MIKKILDFLRRFTGQNSWKAVQYKYKDIVGEKGISLRQKKYKDFFLGFGDKVIIHEGTIFDKPETIILGDNVKINRGCHFIGGGGIFIGSYTMIGPYTFITSINHEIDNKNTFFYESSFNYYPVKIHEHCLLSSYVKIMPGAQIESGSFVASGALVVRSSYPQNSFLSGIPAIHKHSLITKRTEEVVDSLDQDISLVILVCECNYFEHWRFFFLSLGLPQIMCINTVNQIPLSCREVIIISEDISTAVYYKELIKSSNSLINVWIPQTFDYSICHNLDNYFVFNEKTGAINKEIKLDIPKKIIYETHPSKKSGPFCLENSFALSCKYILRTIEKSNKLSVIDLLYALYIADITSEIDQYFTNSLRNSISYHIPINELEAKKQLIIKRKMQGYAEHDVELLNLLYNLELEQPRSSYKLIEHRINCNDTTGIICCYGIIAYYYGYSNLYQLAYDKLINQNYCVEAGYFLTKPRGNSYYYRPLLTIFLSIKYKKIDNYNLIIKREVHSLNWEVNSSNQKTYFDCSDFYDNNTKLYSNSLISNTIFAITPFSCENGREFFIHNTNYTHLHPLLQKIWFLLLKKIILSTANVCIELSPWPKGKKFAVSLRYDVDRPLISQHIINVNNNLKHKWGKICASWYFFLKDLKNPSLQRKLAAIRSYNHEIGLHSLGNCEVNKDMGITFHSGPSSNYWTGLKEIKNSQSPFYTEFLQSQMLYPTIIFKETQAFIVTPLHFPMELSTNKNDNNLIHKNFKEFLTKRISTQLNLGGHIILASHPDITDNYINFFLNKFSLNQGWCVTVDEVVRRIKDIYLNSKIKIFKDSQSYYIKSEINLTDLTIKIHHPDKTKIKILNMKANSGIYNVATVNCK